MSVLGLGKDAALWDIDDALVILLQWAYFERKSGKDVNWSCVSMLERVSQILTEMEKDGNAKDSSNA